MRSTVTSFVLVLALVLILVVPQASNAAFSDYVDRHAQFVDVSLESLYQQQLKSIDENQYDEAASTGKEMLTLLSAGEMSQSRAALVVHRNTAIATALSGHSEAALIHLRRFSEIGNVLYNQFDPVLLPGLLAQAELEIDLGQFTESRDSLNWAQNIIHRHEGVFAVSQIPLLDRLTYINTRELRMSDADTQQLYSVEVIRANYGEDSLEAAASMTTAGSYFARRGGSTFSATGINQHYNPRDCSNTLTRCSLFKRALNFHFRAIKILEAHHGKNSIELIEPLRALAAAHLHRMPRSRSAAERALKRVVKIIEVNPGTDVQDLIASKIALGDFYTITASSKKSAKVYRQAWDMLDGDPALAELRDDYFNTPKRLYPDVVRPKVLLRRPLNAEPETKDFYAEALYNIREDGTVTDVVITEANVPNEARRRVRTDLSASRFRPRFVDGEPASTLELTLHQPFVVISPP